MAAVLNSNVASLYASKNLQAAQSKMADSVERLSSGLRINRASDDAAGLGIANALTQQINGANQGVRNLNDGISMVQTAEGAIAAAQEMAQRIVTLATQGSNGTLGSTERTAIRSEMRQLLVAINGIGTRTKFSGNDLLAKPIDGSGSGYTLQVSNVTTDTISLAEGGFRIIGTGVSAAGTLTDGKIGWSTGQASLLANQVNAVTSADNTLPETQANQLLVLGLAKTYIENLSTQRSLLGAYQNQI
jgi:flagellin